MTCSSIATTLHDILNKKDTRNSHQRCSIKKGVLRNFTKFTGEHVWQSLFSNKVAGHRPVTLLKRRLWYRCFPVNFVKFLRTSFLQNTSGRLLLWMHLCDKVIAITEDLSQGRWHWGVCPSSTFLRSKKKKWKQMKKRKGLKAETIKRLSPRSKYYCFSRSRVSRIQKYFSVFRGPSTLKSISPALFLALT